MNQTSPDIQNASTINGINDSLLNVPLVIVTPFIVSRVPPFSATNTKWFKKLTTKINYTSYRVSYSSQ